MFGLAFIHLPSQKNPRFVFPPKSNFLWQNPMTQPSNLVKEGEEHLWHTCGIKIMPIFAQYLPKFGQKTSATFLLLLLVQN